MSDSKGGKEANSNSGRRSSSSSSSVRGPVEASTAAEARRKTFKRALKGTVGVGLTAASAALIARSDDIGEWLQSVAPHVLPHTGAGADIVLRAIADAKSCFQEGANVCLDAEGRVTALCKLLEFGRWWLLLFVVVTYGGGEPRRDLL